MHTHKRSGCKTNTPRSASWKTSRSSCLQRAQGSPAHAEAAASHGRRRAPQDSKSALAGAFHAHAVAATPRRAQAQNMQRIILAVALFQSCSSFEPKSVYDGGWLNGLTESEAAKYTGYSY